MSGYLALLEAEEAAALAEAEAAAAAALAAEAAAAAASMPISVTEEINTAFFSGTNATDQSNVEIFNFSMDIMEALLWRYNNAENLTALLQAKQNWYDENYTEFWQQWYVNVFNLANANDFGCSVWAIILGLPLNVGTTPPLTDTPFGFGIFNSNFGNSNFSPITTNVIFLSTAQARLLLQLRYYQLTSRGNVLQTNEALANLFGEGNVYLIDNLNMTMTCKYHASALPAALLSVIQEYDVMPRPACVSLSYVSF